MNMPSRKALLSTAAAVALLALLAWAALREPAQLVRVQPVTRGPLTHSFTEEGKTRLKARYVITAPVAGMLRRIELAPGDAVRAGQALAVIEPATSALLDARSRAQAEAEVRGGQGQQAAARQRISAAQAAHALAQASLRRAQPLREAGAISQEAFDQARTRASTAAAELAAARADEQTAAQRVAAARAVLAQEGRAASAAKPLAVPAPVDGVVLKRLLQSAAPVAAGQPLLEVGDAAQLEIEAEVLSTDAVRLAPGMAARVLRWGGQGTLQAAIRRVEPGGFTKVSALGVEEQRTRVILDITSPRAQWAALGDAFRVELEFILQHEENALQVPAGALFRTQASAPAPGTSQAADAAPATETWALYRAVDGRARRTPVQTGLRSATAVQVLQGVAEGERVIIQPDDRLRDGTRIEAH
ncbi:HlyD family efflux transporter periplasmic adaptor subunit [Comamonadaceae bacterium OH2545_COT-014]|nr:HlyD family efflux transporter periplasmic adaptor subunit [Comamonadaceae bacterium OH2545_COT-014]